MSSLNETAQGLAGLLVIGALGYCYCSSGDSRGDPTASAAEMRTEGVVERERAESQRMLELRAEAAEEQAARAERIDVLRTTVCMSADMAEAAEVAIIEMRGHTAIVRQDVLDILNGEAAYSLGAWAAICEAATDSAYLAGEDGARVGRWSIDGGYEPMEAR